MKRAREEDVMVYGVGLAGRMPMGGMGRRGGYGGGGRYPPPPGGWSAAGRTQKPDEGLSKLAAESGGGYFELESTDDLSAPPSHAWPTNCTASTRWASRPRSSTARRTSWKCG